MHVCCWVVNRYRLVSKQLHESSFKVVKFCLCGNQLQNMIDSFNHML